MRQRNLRGDVVASLPAISTQHSIVHCLGPTLDWFLDAFGYSDEFCMLITNARLYSSDLPSFANRLADHISFTEAQWMWGHFEAVDIEQPVRQQYLE